MKWLTSCDWSSTFAITIFLFLINFKMLKLIIYNCGVPVCFQKSKASLLNFFHVNLKSSNMVSLLSLETENYWNNNYAYKSIP